MLFVLAVIEGLCLGCIIFIWWCQSLPNTICGVWAKPFGAVTEIKGSTNKLYTTTN